MSQDEQDSWRWWEKSCHDWKKEKWKKKQKGLSEIKRVDRKWSGFSQKWLSVDILKRHAITHGEHKRVGSRVGVGVRSETIFPSTIVEADRVFKSVYETREYFGNEGTKQRAATRPRGVLLWSQERGAWRFFDWTLAWRVGRDVHNIAVGFVACVPILILSLSSTRTRRVSSAMLTPWHYWALTTRTKRNQQTQAIRSFRSCEWISARAVLWAHFYLANSQFWTMFLFSFVIMGFWIGFFDWESFFKKNCLFFEFKNNVLQFVMLVEWQCAHFYMCNSSLNKFVCFILEWRVFGIEFFDWESF